MDLQSLQSKLDQMAEEARQGFAQAANEAALYEVKVRYLGKKGGVTEILKTLGQLPPEDRPKVGALVNQVRNALEAEYDSALDLARKKGVQSSLEKEQVDVTLPGIRRRIGHLHPVTQVMEEVKGIFRRMGFDLFEGPEVETDYYNFEALNIPANHPARAMQDTFYIGGPVHPASQGSDTPQAPSSRTGKAGSSTLSSEQLLLRTHTSPVQIRVMEQGKPPIRMVAPGPVYRCDSDVSHTPMFHQIEGLVVDKGIHLGHLKGIVESFLKQVFTPDTKVRFRPSYFPFTEPSAEVDIGCVFCKGTTAGDGHCRICKGTGWLEIMGCGMVDPTVLGFVKIDTDVYSGFAFGIGIERVTMLKYGINDLRLFFENQTRFLEQF